MTWAWFISLGVVALIARRGIAGWMRNWRDDSLKQWAYGGLIFFGFMATFGLGIDALPWYLHFAAAITGIMGFFAVSELTGRSARRASALRLDEVKRRLEESQARRDRMRMSSLRQAAREEREDEEGAAPTPAGSPAHVTEILARAAEHWERVQAEQTESLARDIPIVVPEGPKDVSPEPAPRLRGEPMRINLGIESKLGRGVAPAASQPPPPLEPISEPELTAPPLAPVSEAEAEERPAAAPAQPVAGEVAQPAQEPAAAPVAAGAAADRPAGPVSLGQSAGPRPSGPVSLGGPSTLAERQGPVSLGQTAGRPAAQGPAKLERMLTYQPSLVQSRLGKAPETEEESEAQAKGDEQVVEV